MNQSLAVVAAAAALWLRGDEVAGAQSVATRSSYAIACGTCSIVFDKVVTLGTRWQDSLGVWVFPVRMRDGRYIAVAADRLHLIAFDSTGAALARVGWSSGERGPFGATGIVGLATGPGDTLYVAQLGRVTVLTPTLLYVRDVPLPAGSISGLAVLRDGTMVIVT